jgi:LacI family transcriptional regulator
MALAWLREQGHQHIVFIGGPKVSQVAVAREQAYREYIANWADARPANVFRGDFSRLSGYHQAVEIMKSDPMPSAVLAASDAMALGAIKAFKDHGLRVPVDISVMGYDGAAAGEYSDPGLSTISQNANAIGEGAVASILDRIDGKKVPENNLVEPSLVIRESVRRIPR